jgi:hypothetical protein
MIGPNKLECNITLAWKESPDTNTPSFWPMDKLRRKYSVVNRHLGAVLTLLHFLRNLQMGSQS